MDALIYPAPPDSHEIECAGQDEIQAVQNEGLRRLLARVRVDSPFYQRLWREAGVDSAAIRAVGDLRHLPLISRDDIERDLALHPPFGQFQGGYPAVRIQASSGTVGKPKPIFYSQRDWQNVCTFWARRLVAQGVRPGDLVQNAFTYGLFIPGFTSSEGAMRIGATLLPTGSGAVTSSEKQVLMAHEWGTTVLGGVPTYVLHLANVAEEQGLHPARDFRIRVTFHGGELLTEETRRKIEERWGCKAYDNYGSVEQGAPAWECEAQDGHHVNEDAYYYEVVDPRTGQPLPDGAEGALVVTTLYKECAPMIRYVTGDITALVSERCRCGRTFKRLTGIRGRLDDMLKIRGSTVFPAAIEQVVRSFGELGTEYRIVVSTTDGLDQLTVRCETRAAVEPPDLNARLVRALRVATGLSCVIELLPPGSLSAEMEHRAKPRRLVDLRMKGC